MDTLLTSLRAVAEPTRLRVLALLARGELAVSELTHILGQSQPRVSRHLKLLCEAGLLDRFPEGAWVFYRLSGHGAARRLLDQALRLIDPADPAPARDADRLKVIREERSATAVAHGPCECVVINARNFNDLLREFPETIREMLVEMARRLRDTSDRGSAAAAPVVEPEAGQERLGR